MIGSTEAQRETLARMPRFRVVAQFTTGAVVAVSGQHYQNASVIDSNGDVFSFSRYLARLDQRDNVRPAPSLNPSA